MNGNYMRLYEHYRRMFALVDGFCFNSSNTRRIYRGHIEVPPLSTVLPMVHAGISDNRTRRSVDGRPLRLGFIGSEAPFKGLPLLKGALDDLLQLGVQNWSLSVWGGRNKADTRNGKISFRGAYTFEQLKNVFDQMDLLIVPSICNETFSLITLEALSYGLPVLTSSTVGAKDIVATYDKDFVFSNRESLMATLKRLCENAEPLRRYNQRIVEQVWPYSHEAHVKAVRDWYQSLMRPGDAP